MSGCEQGPEQRRPGSGPDSTTGLGVGAEAPTAPETPVCLRLCSDPTPTHRVQTEDRCPDPHAVLPAPTMLPRREASSLPIGSPSRRPCTDSPPPAIPHRPAPALPAPRRSSSPSPQRLACPSSSPSSAISLSPSFFHGDGDLEPLPALTAGTPPPSLPLRPRPSPLPPVCPQCCPAGSRARAGSGHLLILSQRDGVTPTGLRAGAGSPRMASDSSRHGSPGTGTVVGQGATGRSWASGSHLGLAGD